MQPLEYTVSAQDKGERLDRFVSRMAGITRMTAQRLISEGAVKVDGRLLHKSHLLQTGEHVEVMRPEPAESGPPPQDIPLSIIYQDADLAVVDKPPGLVVHPGAGHDSGTLVNALLYALDDLSGIGGVLRPGIVHRLDRDTSGLMVVAKNDLSHVRLQEMVKDRSLKRYYYALVHGVPATRFGTVDAPIGRDARDRKRMAVTSVSARPAVTNFEVERDFGTCSLLKVELVTGRTHQIRVHLAHIGHPVAGDREYGVRDQLETALGLERQFLHAFRLSFPHPATGQALDFQVPLPKDLDETLQGLLLPRT
ncbi:MAG: RluA family pseudouridine synthase [Actinomycetota bacterium]